MVDAHCHIPSGDPSVRELLIGRDFAGTHPWTCDAYDAAALKECLAADPQLGVGEIGLDRLRERTISPRMREVFQDQLRIAADFGRPVVLHGAKCWGEVVAAVRTLVVSPPALLFHGFSRSDGLIPDIVALNGYISVGPAVLNDHAVNYRELAKKIPAERLLVETDRDGRDPEQAKVSVRDVLAKLAEIRGVSAAELESLTDANAVRFRNARPQI